MTSFIDTSAFLAILDADDENHSKAGKKWEELIDKSDTLVCSSYILIETFALIQHRLGMKAVRSFQEDVVPILTVKWVHESVHEAGVTSMLAANRRELSLVDCVSFDMMRRLGIKIAFVFDKHFKEQGFQCLP
ncbi:MAG: PIN domain-containing protein [Candidatus Neomarinimicrobiota bacterium]